MKILNLYSGIGGNRRLWGDEHQITAVELDEEIALIYRHFFPNDIVVNIDAHKYLIEHLEEFDFIWSSPPCQSHSSFTQNLRVNRYGEKPRYPDFKIYEEIMLLIHNYSGLFVFENVKPYYQPLIKPSIIIDRHLYWSNFKINVMKEEIKKDKLRTAQIPELQRIHNFDLSRFKLKNKRQVLRNCVTAEVGLHILKEAEKAFNEKHKGDK